MVGRHKCSSALRSILPFLSKYAMLCRRGSLRSRSCRIRCLTARPTSRLCRYLEAANCLALPGAAVRRAVIHASGGTSDHFRSSTLLPAPRNLHGYRPGQHVPVGFNQCSALFPFTAVISAHTAHDDASFGGPRRASKRRKEAPSLRRRSPNLPSEIGRNTII